MRTLRIAAVLTVLLSALTGLLYPAAVTSLAQVLFPRQAAGSFVEVNGRVVGSELIGQTFTADWYFHSRPSAAGAGYDAAASSGTNRGPTSQLLLDSVTARAASQIERNGVSRGEVPTDAVTASASGLDPHISPANAQSQIARVAAARGVTPAELEALVTKHTEGRQFGLLGEPRVNVLLLNVALDSAYPRP